MATVRRVRFAVLSPQFASDKAKTEGARVGLKQRAVLDILGHTDQPMQVTQLLEQAGASGSTLRSLESRGWITVSTERVAVDAPSFDLPRHEPAYSLNAEQQAAAQRIQDGIDRGKFEVTLLHGVGGSGVRSRPIILPSFNSRGHQRTNAKNNKNRA